MTLIPHSCAVCSSFLQIEGLARGKEPVSRDWIELVEWKSTEADEVLGGDFQLARPLTTILQPRMLVMDLSSSNANPAVATAGDTVSLLLVASRSVYMPFVTIGGIEAAVELDGGREGESTFSGSQWMASRVITAGEGDVSELGVTVNFEDLFGNARVQKELSDGSLRVMVDSSRPQVSVAAAGGTPADGGAFGPLTNTRLFMTGKRGRQACQKALKQKQTSSAGPGPAAAKVVLDAKKRARFMGALGVRRLLVCFCLSAFWHAWRPLLPPIACAAGDATVTEAESSSSSSSCGERRAVSASSSSSSC